MICTELWNGSGLGNQLHSYVMCRVLALDRGVNFSIMGKEKFKGHNLFDLDFGKQLVGGKNLVEGMQPIELPYGIENYYMEKKEVDETGADIRDYDWDGVLKIKDSTKIEGYWQGEKYYKHHKKLIDEWFKVEPMDMLDNMCVIGFRGGEYQYFPELFLPQTYWDNAIEHMRNIRPNMQFRVVTDDPFLAKKFFPQFEITHAMVHDWRSIRYAKYLILANSSFHIFPAWLNDTCRKIIAPKYWARHNLGFWALKQNKMEGWHYLDKDNNLSLL